MFNYLKKYVSETPPIKKDVDIWFSRIKDEKIQAAEKLLGFQFPVELRAFYQEIGYGYILGGKHKISLNEKMLFSNRIMPPQDVVPVYFGGNPIFGECDKDVLPFFETSDGDMFVLDLSDKLAPVCLPSKVKRLADSFGEFIYKLYNEDPLFYIR